jgi:hypothetical protein
MRPLVDLVLVLAVACPTLVWAAGPPLQANVAVDVPAGGGESAQVAGALDGGGATFTANVTNREDLRTAVVSLRFVYRIPPDTIALDEIVNRIVVETRDQNGERFGRTVIDPNDINLNPNGPTLVYRATMYRPEEAYRLRIRVFGNYE